MSQGKRKMDWSQAAEQDPPTPKTQKKPKKKGDISTWMYVPTTLSKKVIMYGQTDTPEEEIHRGLLQRGFSSAGVRCVVKVLLGLLAMMKCSICSSQSDI